MQDSPGAFSGKRRTSSRSTNVTSHQLGDKVPRKITLMLVPPSCARIFVWRSSASLRCCMSLQGLCTISSRPRTAAFSSTARFLRTSAPFPEGRNTLTWNQFFDLRRMSHGYIRAVSIGISAALLGISTALLWYQGFDILSSHLRGLHPAPAYILFAAATVSIGWGAGHLAGDFAWRRMVASRLTAFVGVSRALLKGEVMTTYRAIERERLLCPDSQTPCGRCGLKREI